MDISKNNLLCYVSCEEAPIYLSERYREVMTMYCNETPIKDIADAFALTPSQIRNYIQSAIEWIKIFNYSRKIREPQMIEHATRRFLKASTRSQQRKTALKNIAALDNIVFENDAIRIRYENLLRENNLLTVYSLWEFVLGNGPFSNISGVGNEINSRLMAVVHSQVLDSFDHDELLQLEFPRNIFPRQYQKFLFIYGMYTLEHLVQLRDNPGLLKERIVLKPQSFAKIMNIYLEYFNI